MIRVGIGGWTYEPWRGTFYPEGLKQADELRHASHNVTSIEINGTLYRTQSAASFKKWRDETPENFVFAIKGHRAVVNAKKLAETREPLDWFFKSGVLELGEKLGPILWQLAPFKKFDAADLTGFFELLPREANGRAILHALEVRHASFLVPEFIALARKHNVATVFADSDDYPAIGDVTGDFVYARLQRTKEDHDTGYAAADLDGWAKRAKLWEKGGTPTDLPQFDKKAAAKTPRPVFIYMIAGAKIRAPAAAIALIKRLDE